MQKVNLISPAFPPQVAQDQFGRFIAPIPGISKLEYFALKLLPSFLQIGLETRIIGVNGGQVTAYQAAIEAAKELLDQLEKDQEKNNTQADIINLNND